MESSHERDTPDAKGSQFNYILQYVRDKVCFKLKDIEIIVDLFISSTPSWICQSIFWARNVRVDSGLDDGINRAHRADLTMTIMMTTMKILEDLLKRVAKPVRGTKVLSPTANSWSAWPLALLGAAWVVAYEEIFADMLWLLVAKAAG